MDIKIGDYIRTKDGYIGIYHSDTTITDIINLKDKDGIFCTSKNNIKKYSKNIIKLIKKGDYVNGYKVLYVGKDYVDIDCNKPSEDTYIFDNDFKAIVTKEQFKSIEYEV